MQVTHVRNKNSNIQGRTLNAIKMIFHSIRNCSKRKVFFSFLNFGCVLSRDFFRWQFQLNPYKAFDIVYDFSVTS